MTTELLQIPLDQIDPGKGRPRELDPEHAQGLADSIAMQGLICPITVRMVGSGYQLVDGLHRFEGFRLLGRETIPAILSEKDSDDAAMLDAVTANLARRISALDFCKHLFVLKKAWLRLHPETTHGGDRKSAKIKSRKPALDPEEPEITAFDGAMAAKFDMGRTQIKEAVAIWNGLTAPSRAALRGTALAEKKTELKALSKESRNRQAQILELILSPAHPDIQNVAEALFHLENGITPNMVERRYLAATKTLGSLDDVLFDRVIMAQEERVIASLKRRGRI